MKLTSSETDGVLFKMYFNSLVHVQTNGFRGRMTIFILPDIIEKLPQIIENWVSFYNFDMEKV